MSCCFSGTVPSPFNFWVFSSLLHISVVAELFSGLGSFGPLQSDCIKLRLWHLGTGTHNGMAYGGGII